MVETVKYTSISINEILSSKLRLEANVFNVDARTAKNTLLQSKYGVDTLVNSIKKCYYGGRAKRNYVSKYAPNSIGFIGSAEMLEINPNPVKFFSTDTMDIAPFKVVKGTILISRSGTIGNVTYVNNTLSKFLVSEHAIRIIPKEFGGYLYTYFKTKIGKTIVQSNSFGAVILQIEPEHLESVIIPNAPLEIKNKIHNLIVKSYRLRDESNSLLNKAENLLVKNLNLPPINSIKLELLEKDASVKTYSVKLGDLNNRFDGSYHNPIINVIIDLLLDNAISVKPLSALSKEINMPGIFKRIYVDKGEGVPFLGTNDILELSPNIEKFLSITAHKKLIETSLAVKENTILITDRGTIGNVVLIPEYYEKENWTVSQNSIRIIPKDLSMAGYIYVFLNSEYGKALSKRETYGAVIDMIDPNNVAKIPIPIVEDNIVKEINDLALEANKLRSEAYYKEQEALKIMNEEVIYAT